ncbi:hypothetical protein ABET51_12835 [Metabacillus fastidiosus]|uniref:hypothetical protein n=1 Tax=Metabacillus fastidiosus TaxID=1458 RepID=UPI003D294424
MEQKTAEIINKICKLDSEVLPIVLMKHYEIKAWLYDKFDDVGDLERSLEELGLNKVNYREKLLLYCGFPPDDEIADDFIYDYCFSEGTDRMDVLKKQLIEWAIETEGLDE